MPTSDLRRNRGNQVEKCQIVVQEIFCKKFSSQKNNELKWQWRRMAGNCFKVRVSFLCNLSSAKSILVMSERCEFESLDIPTGSEAALNVSEASCRPLRTARLKAGEAVFRTGDHKDFIFRIERGSIGISWVSPSGVPELLEEIGPETVFGLGFLDAYIHNALALTESVVSCWPKSALPFLEDLDILVKQRAGLETEREFVHRRETLVASAPTKPHQRVAGFLCVAARINVSDGRDPLFIDETVECGSVGAFLKMSLDVLGGALVELSKRDLIEHAQPRGLRILDLDALQSLAAASESVVPINESTDKADA